MDSRTLKRPAMWIAMKSDRISCQSDSFSRFLTLFAALEGGQHVLPLMLLQDGLPGYRRFDKMRFSQVHYYPPIPKGAITKYETR